MKNGRIGSKAARVATQAPPMPINSSTRGPTQQIDAPMAANAPAASEPLTLSDGTATSET